MKEMIKSSNFFRKSVFAIIIFLAVYCSHDTILFGNTANQLFILIRKIIPFIIVALSLFIVGKRITPLHILAFCIIALLPVLSCIVNHEEIFNYIYRFVLMLGAFFLSVTNGKKLSLKEAFNKILSFLCIWSIIFWLLSFTPLVTLFPSITLSTGVKCPFSLFSCVMFDHRYNVFRNTSIFREPGVFMTMLTIGILLEFSSARQNNKRIILFLLSILTTLSTAGIFVGALIIIYGVLFGNKNSIKNKIVLISLTAFASAFIIIALPELISSVIFDKFSYSTSGYGSWYARAQSIFQNIKISVNNPFFGIGRYNLYNTILGKEGNYVAIDNTNTFLINFSAFGILYGFICLLGGYNFFRTNGLSRFKSLLLFLILFIALSNEDLGQNIIYFAIVFTGVINMKMFNKNNAYQLDRCIVYEVQNHQY